MTTHVVPADAAGLAEAKRALERGAVVAIPTDTVYGLACLPGTPAATGRLFELKRRPSTVNLQVLVADIDSARSLSAPWSPAAVTLAERYWPGGVTVVLERAPGLEWDLGESKTTVGIRCPAHPVPRELCRAVGPIAATSANLHGEPTPTSASGVACMFPSGIDVIVDGGSCAETASTVVDLTGEEPRCLREGTVTWRDLLSMLNGVDHVGE